MKDVAARVVAWHNRHPLARRIKPGDVSGIGVVTIPCAPSDALPAGTAPQPSSRWRAMLHTAAARLAAPLARLKKLRKKAGGSELPADFTTLFSEDFIPRLSTARIARFALRWGQLARPGEAHWPQRVVAADVASTADPAVEPQAPDAQAPAPAPVPAPSVEITPVYLLTAALGADPGKHRLLLAPNPQQAVLGQRLWSRPRLLGAAAALLCLTALLSWVLLRHGHAKPALHPPAVAASAPASAPAFAASAEAASAPAAAASAASDSDAAASAPQAASAAAEGHEHGDSKPGDAADAPASAAEAAPASSASQGHGAKPGEEARKPAGSARAKDEGREAAKAATKPGAEPAASGRYYALLTRGPRSRAEAEQQLVRMKAAANALREESGSTQTEVMNIGGTWRAVWWPFPSREAATTARWALALKGVTVDVVEF